MHEINRPSKLLFVIAVVTIFATVFSCVLTFVSPFDFANASNPDGYLDAVQTVTSSDADWFYDSKYLGFSSTYATIVNLLADTAHYDWAYLEENPVVIAAIESGVDVEHEIFMEDDADLTNDVFLHQAGDTIGWNVCNAEDRYDLTDTTSDSHGTHVNGIFAMLLHYFGLEKYIKILPIKASYGNLEGQAQYNLSDVLNALNYAKTAGADVVNLSLGVLQSSGSSYGFGATDFTSACNQAVLVAAAGNKSKDSAAVGDSWFYPAANTGVVGVMNYTKNATTGAVELSPTSDFGLAYDIVAPGTNIVSAITSTFIETSKRHKVSGSGDHDNYGTLTGTSMSAPFVSFAAALLTAKYRAQAHKANTSEPTPSIIADMLTDGYVCPTMNFASTANPSATYTFDLIDYNSLLNTDFLDEDGRIYVEPTGITIEETLGENGQSRLSQTIADIQAVTLSANLAPLNYTRASRVNWYSVVNGVETLIASGKTCIYTPPSAVDTYTIKASTTNSVKGEISSTVTITVGYYPLNSVNARFVQGDYYVGNALNVTSGADVKLSLAYAQYAMADTEIKWYVDGQYVMTGAEFAYSFANVGDYLVQAKVNGAFTTETLRVVVEEEDKVLSAGAWAGILCGAWAFAMLLGFAVFWTLTTVTRRRGEELKFFNGHGEEDK